MKYLNGKDIKLGDIVYWRNSAPKEEGVVVCLIDDLTFLGNYDYTALKKNGGWNHDIFSFNGVGTNRARWQKY